MRKNVDVERLANFFDVGSDVHAQIGIEAPVLVIYGEYDQYEMREGHKLIADTVNKLRPGAATFVEIPGVDHGLIKYSSADAAYREEGGSRDNELFLRPVLDWLRKIEAGR